MYIISELVGHTCRVASLADIHTMAVLQQRNSGTKTKGEERKSVSTLTLSPLLSPLSFFYITIVAKARQCPIESYVHPIHIRMPSCHSCDVQKERIVNILRYVYETISLLHPPHCLPHLFISLFFTPFPSLYHLED